MHMYRFLNVRSLVEIDVGKGILYVGGK